MRVGTVAVGEVRGVVLDPEHSRVIGLEVVGADRAGRFLPWVAVGTDFEGICARSALFLVDELESYARRGAVVLRSVDDDDPREVCADGLVRVSPESRTGNGDATAFSPASPARPRIAGERVHATGSA